MNTQHQSKRRSRAAARSAVTLVELLVVICVAAILIALTTILLGAGVRFANGLDARVSLTKKLVRTAPTKQAAHGRLIPGQYIVLLRDGADAQRELQRLLQPGWIVLHVYVNTSPGFAVQMPAAAVSALLKDPAVKYIEQDQTLLLARAPRSFTKEETSSGLERINAAQAPAAPAAIDADIAVIDTGVDPANRDLDVVFSKSFGSWRDAKDTDGHGTQVACIAAAQRNHLGVVGVAPGARIWSLKVADGDGAGAASDLIAALDFVVGRAAEIDVANVSLGTGRPSPAVNLAARQCVQAGVVVVAAAGNNQRDAAGTSPASELDVITVAALADTDGQSGGHGQQTAKGEVDDTVARFSNYGPAVDFLAPGVSIDTLDLANKPSTASGTSVAAAHVSGLAARMSAGRARRTSRSVEADLHALVIEHIPGPGRQAAYPVVNAGLTPPKTTWGRLSSLPVASKTMNAAPFAKITRDPPIVWTVQIYDVYPVAENQQQVTIGVWLYGELSGVQGPFTVKYQTSDGTAEAGEDYEAASGTLTFDVGVHSTTFDVTINSDALVEGDETFQVTLSEPTNTGGTTTLVLGDPSTYTVTITDSTPPPPTLQFATSDFSAAESDGKAEITVTLAGDPSGQTVTVDYQTSNGTAQAGQDYTATTGTLTFPPGITSQSFEVSLSTDLVNEDPETVQLTLSNPSTNAELGDPDSATLTISDSTRSPWTVQFYPGYSSVENAGTVTIGVYLYGSWGGGEGPFTVKYQTSDGTAKAGEDYVAASGTLTFEKDVHSAYFDVEIKTDAVIEQDETFTITLSDPVNTAESPVLLLGDPSTVTVTLSDVAPVLTLTPEKAAICAGGFSSEIHQTIVTATLTDGANPIAGETIGLSTDRGYLNVTSGLTDANGQVKTTLTSNGTASGAATYSSTVTASTSAGQYGPTESCEVEFQAPTVVLSTTYKEVFIGETMPVKVTVSWVGQKVANHTLEWSISPYGNGSFDNGASTATDIDGIGTATYEASGTDGAVELQVVDTSVTLYDGSERPKDSIQADVTKGLKIQRKRDGEADYQDLDENNTAFLPGEYVNLRVVLDSKTAKADQHEWEIPTKHFKDYKHNNKNAALVPLEAVDLTGQGVAFYWVDAGAKTVKAKARIGKVWAETTASFVVIAPTITKNEITFGDMQFLDGDKKDGSALGFLNKNADGLVLDGFIWVAGIDVPGPFAPGEFSFVQKIKLTAFHTAADGAKWERDQNGKWALDLADPYPKVQAKTILETNSLNGVMGDAPMMFLDSTKRLASSADWSFETYLMFRPAGTNSCYVPLKMTTWGCKGTATYDAATKQWNSSATGKAPGQGTPTIVDATSHPEWELNSTDATFQLVF